MASVIGMMGGKGCSSWGQIKEKERRRRAKIQTNNEAYDVCFSFSCNDIYFKKIFGDFLELNPKIIRLLMIGIADSDEYIEGESREQKRSRKE
ncbi:hypothetical protein GQ457_06G008450 [Hibiscus cannabinus]